MKKPRAAPSSRSRAAPRIALPVRLRVDAVAAVAGFLAGDDVYDDAPVEYDAKRVAKNVIARYVAQLRLPAASLADALAARVAVARALPSNAAELVDVDEEALASAIDRLLRLEWVDDTTIVTDGLRVRVVAAIDAIFSQVVRSAEEAGERRVFAWAPCANVT